MTLEQTYKKTGYLNSDFKLFHNTDQLKRTFTFHYHDFHKILILLRGNVSYAVEGRQYDLIPGDIVLVSAGEIHRPIIHDTSVYERIIVYVLPSFFQQLQKDGYDLFHCFEQSQARQSSLLRIPGWKATGLEKIIPELIFSSHSDQYASELYQKLKFMEFLILLNRAALRNPMGYTTAVTSNPAVANIMKYINDHLSEDTLSVDTIAQAAFLNRSYLMHLFKAETGYTIGKYITEKRLFLARGYISSGLSVTEACYLSGFKNYTSFYYAYRNKYHSAPTADEPSICAAPGQDAE